MTDDYHAIFGQLGQTLKLLQGFLLLHRASRSLFSIPCNMEVGHSSLPMLKGVSLLPVLTRCRANPSSLCRFLPFRINLNPLYLQRPSLASPLRQSYQRHRHWHLFLSTSQPRPVRVRIQTHLLH